MVNRAKKIKTMLISCILFISIFLIGYNNVDAIGRIDKNYYSEQIVGDAYKAPKIDKVTVGGGLGDLVVVDVTPGTSRLTKFYLQNTKVSSDYEEIYVNGSTSQTKYYLSLRNGTYRLYVQDASGLAYKFDYDISITSSCSDTPLQDNVIGKSTSKRCFISYGGDNIVSYTDQYVGRCASGYHATDLVASGCNFSKSDISNYGLGFRYCQMTFSFNCVKDTESTPQKPKLASLSLSSGSLSPAFSPDVTSYTATVNASSVNINATLNQDGSEFVTGSGPRSVSLVYGANTFKISVKSTSGEIVTYTIKITRPDGRSKVNTLKSLSMDGINFNEAFSPSRTSYTANVDNSVSKAYINAELTDSRSSFVSGYGPRNINIGVGVNTILVKVKSETGTTKTYTIKVVRAGESGGSSGNEPTTPPVENTDNLALLKALNIQQEGINVEPQFDPKNLEYNITVPYEISSLLLSPVAQNETDKVIVEGNENLLVEEPNEVTITVTTTDNFIRVYKINVIRKGEELVINTDSSLKELKIEGKDLEFNPETYNYNVVLAKDETSLGITATANADTSTVEILDNENLQLGSKVTVRVMAEDATFTDYVLTVTGIEKGTNVFLIIIIVIILVLIIAYTILRILGYKIYFNFSMLSSLFGKKDKDSDDE